MNRKKILVIEDEYDIAQLLKIHLTEICDHVALAYDGELGYQLASQQDWHAIVLDLKLPKMDGLELCRRLRSQEKYVPILMLTAKSTELDRVLGLEIGADDYLTKPFSVMELTARVKALIRRFDAIQGYQQNINSTHLEFDGLQVFSDERLVIIDGQEIELTAKEFDLLHFFASHPDKVFNRSQLLDHVWGYGHEGYEHTVNSHMNRLRTKIEPSGHQPKYIKTVWGVGYKFIGNHAHSMNH